MPYQFYAGRSRWRPGAVSVHATAALIEVAGVTHVQAADALQRSVSRYMIVTL